MDEKHGQSTLINPRDILTHDMHFLRRYWLLISAVFIGAILRMTNLNWDAGGRLHPDEALIINGVLSVKLFSQLFPGFHDYNGFSVYLLKIMTLFMTFITHDASWSQTPEGVTVAGRYVSAVLSTMSILLVYLSGKRIWNNRVGLLAAILIAALPLHIQLAHFYTTESILVCLFLILIYGTALYMEVPNMHSLVRMSVAAGLLIATKNTSYLFLPIPIIGILMNKKGAGRTIQAMAICTGISVTVFFLASPYSFIDFLGYAQRSAYLRDVVSGRLLMDWTVQFMDTNGWFWIPNIGISFGPAAMAGCIGMIGSLLHRKKTAGNMDLLLAVWGIGFSLFLSLTYLKFIRYSAPLLPLMALFGAKFLSDIYSSRLGKMLVYGCAGLQIIMGIMYVSIYLKPHTSLVAAQWIRRTVPPGSIIIIEEWNSIIRLNRPEFAGTSYTLRSFNFYSLPDDEKKMKYFSAISSDAAYIILESPKVKNTITRLSARYPKSSRWYADLDAGNLGFKKVMTFSSYPAIGPVLLPDEWSEETYTVFDHPTITVYKREGVCAPGIACNQ